MDINYLKKLTKIFTDSNVDEIEIEEEGLKLRISKNRQNSSINVAPPQPYIPTYQLPVPEAPPPKPAEVSIEPAKAPVIVTPEKKYHELKSPIVGTFYRAPSPDADSYVEVGQTIQKGTVLCIIEAMKLMNEIESDVSGRIVQIKIDNAQPVEYNQVLFLIEPV